MSLLMAPNLLLPMPHLVLSVLILLQLQLKVIDVMSHILHPASHQPLQEMSVLLQLLVIRVIVPTLNGDPILSLTLEVVLNVVNNDRFLQVSAQTGEILYIHSVLQSGVVSVESVRDKPLLVQVINDPVGIVLQTRCEHCHFVVL
jgi:hypothetical protein